MISPLESFVVKDLTKCKIFVNGKWVGIHYKPQYLYKVLRLFKLNSIINIQTSIS